MNNQIKIISDWLGTDSIDIFGSPFSGKDTQGKILADLVHGHFISGGEILRSQQDPTKIEKILNEGGIVPSDFFLNLMEPYLSKTQYQGRPLILSAVGRVHGEETEIMKAIANSGHALKAVIFLKINEEVVWQRFEASKQLRDRGDRADDSQQALHLRLKKYLDRTVPVLDYYQQKGLLIEIDGSLEVDQVTKTIVQKLVDKISI